MGEPEGFSPRRPASRRRRVIALFLVGPVLWVILLAVVARVVQGLNVIEIGLAVAAVSFVLALALLLPMRVRRVREERRAGELATPR